MACALEVQLKVVAVVETIVCALFLGLNMKILVQLTMQDSIHSLSESRPEPNSRFRYTISEAALVMYFTIRVLYLIGEFILALFLSYNVFRRNVNGLMLWFFMTIIFSIPSRCYFIGGVLWDNYFVITVAVFSLNLAFTTYSLVIICFYIKQLSRNGTAESSRRGSLVIYNNELPDAF